MLNMNKYFVVLVSLKNAGKDIFCYLLTDTESSRKLEKSLLLKKEVKLNDFGKVLFLCEGSVPEDIKTTMEEEFGFIKSV